MNTPIVIPNTAIDEDDLQQWVADTEKLTGARIFVDRQYLVRSESEAVHQALAALFGSPVALKPRKMGKKTLKTDEPKATYKLNPAPEREIKAWRLLDAAGEVVDTLTLDEKIRRLNVGGFEEGAILHHPRAGKQRVIGAPGTGQGTEPVGY